MADSAPTPDRDDDESEVASPDAKPMGFLDHLEELRVTLMKCAATLVVFLVFIGYFLLEFKAGLEWPWRHALRHYPDLSLQFRTDSPMEVYGIMVQICVAGSLALAMPLLLVWIGQFVAPALTAREKRAVAPAVVSALILFLLGGAFGFFLITPKAIEIAVEANQWMNFQMLWTADSYYSLMMWLTLGLGGIFEFPLLIVGVTYFGIIELDTLRRSRRIVLLVCFIVAAVVTPTPDWFTQTAVAGPMYGLFELSLLVSAALLRRKALAENPDLAKRPGSLSLRLLLVLLVLLGGAAWLIRRDAVQHAGADGQPRYFWKRSGAAAAPATPTPPDRPATP